MWNVVTLAFADKHGYFLIARRLVSRGETLAKGLADQIDRANIAKDLCIVERVPAGVRLLRAGSVDTLEKVA